MVDLTRLETREQLKERYRKAFPDHSAGRVATNAGQIHRSVREIRQEDYVLTYIKSSREMLIGHVARPYEYHAEAHLDHYPHIRQVQWLQKVFREDFGPQARNSMGGTLTVFQLDDYPDQIDNPATGAPRVPPEEEQAPPF